MSYDGLTFWTYSTERDQVPLNFSWHSALWRLCFSGRSTQSDSLIPVLKEGGLSDFHWRRMRFWPIHKARAVAFDLETATTSGCIFFSKFVIWIVTAVQCFKLNRTLRRTNGGSVDAFQAKSPECPTKADWYSGSHDADSGQNYPKAFFFFTPITDQNKWFLPSSNVFNQRQTTELITSVCLMQDDQRAAFVWMI